jgi:hypothetical protein
LLQQGIPRHGVELIGYCLMSNHVHLVAVPQSEDALARSLKQDVPFVPFGLSCLSGTDELTPTVATFEDPMGFA